MYKYPLIIFEGIEGSGKTTQIKNVVKFLKKKNIKFLSLREPGGSNQSEKIRKLILSNKSKFHPFTDLLLYLAARNENIQSIIKKNYKKKVIIIDRFIYSTLAYQFYGMNLSLDIINNLNKYIIGNIKPDFIFLHTVNRSNLKKRMKKRKIKNRYDKFNYEFYNKVQKGFVNILKKKKNVMLINTNKTINENKEEILNKIKKII